MNKKAVLDLLQTVLIIAQAINPKTSTPTDAEVKYCAMVVYLNAKQADENTVWRRDIITHFYFQSERFEDNTYQIMLKFRGHWIFDEFGTLEQVMPKITSLVSEWINRIARTSDDTVALLASLLNILDAEIPVPSMPKGLLTLAKLGNTVYDIIYTEGEGQRMFKMEKRLSDLVYDKFLEESEYSMVAYEVIDYIQTSKMLVEPSIRVAIMYDTIERLGDDPEYIFEEIIRDNNIANYRDLVNHFFDWN